MINNDTKLWVSQFGWQHATEEGWRAFHSTNGVYDEARLKPLGLSS